jgi:hypothetical protein
MAIRCLGRAFLGGTTTRDFVLRCFALMVFRALDLAAFLRAGDFFCATLRAADRDLGFCLAILHASLIPRTRLREAPIKAG